MPPNNITILAICTVLCICAGGRGVCKIVHHHIPNTKLTQHDDNIRILPARAHSSSQYFDACKGLIHLYVTMTIHTAHAQKHSPETKSKVRPKNMPWRLELYYARTTRRALQGAYAAVVGEYY